MFLASKREKQRRRRKREKAGKIEWWRMNSLPSGIVDQRPEGEVPTRLMGPASLEVPLAAVERRRRRSEGQDPARVREAQEADS